jgi:hypothetical protein
MSFWRMFRGHKQTWYLRLIHCLPILQVLVPGLLEPWRPAHWGTDVPADCDVLNLALQSVPANTIHLTCKVQQKQIHISQLLKILSLHTMNRKLMDSLHSLHWGTNSEHNISFDAS